MKYRHHLILLWFVLFPAVLIFSPRIGRSRGANAPLQWSWDLSSGTNYQARKLYMGSQYIQNPKWQKDWYNLFLNEGWMMIPTTFWKIVIFCTIFTSCFVYAFNRTKSSIILWLIWCPGTIILTTNAIGSYKQAYHWQYSQMLLKKDPIPNASKLKLLNAFLVDYSHLPFIIKEAQSKRYSWAKKQWLRDKDHQLLPYSFRDIIAGFIAGVLGLVFFIFLLRKVYG